MTDKLTWRTRRLSQLFTRSGRKEWRYLKRADYEVQGFSEHNPELRYLDETGTHFHYRADEG